MSLRDFTEAYIETALWSSTDSSREDGGDPMDQNYGPSDIASATRRKMESDCRIFYEKMEKTIDAACAKDTKGNCDDGRAGHDFWLNRNGHGAGYWDGDWPEPEAAKLDKASERFGEFTLFVGDDKKIHGMKG